MEIRDVPLGELASVVTKGTTPTTLGRPFVENGINFVKAESINADGGFIADKLAKIDSETHELLARSQLQPGDILFSIAGVIGRTGLVHQELLPANTNQAVAIIRLGSADVDRRFLFYQLRSDEFLQYSLGRVVQTAQANVSLGVLKSAPVRVPSIEVQRKVAACISAYDDLIALNLRRIQTLEESAHAIYREWFLSSDDGQGSLDSGATPMTKFGEIADEVRAGVHPTQVDPGTPYVGLEHIPRRSILLSDWGQASAVASRKWRFTEGDILFGKLRPYFHKVVRAPLDGIASTDTIVIRPRKGFEEVALLAAATEDFVAQASAAAGGTDRPRAAWGDLAAYQLPIPLEKLDHFRVLISPLLELLVNLAEQNRNLRTTRDLVLPRLISGDVDVSTLEIDTSWLAA